MGKVDWKQFWESYRKKEAETEADLYAEVGKTINKEPLSEKAFQLSIDLVARNLQLKTEDRLLELCCGNGLMTRRLAPSVEEIRAVDFAEHLIAHALKFSAASNVSYFCADAVAFLRDLVSHRSYLPSKVLLGDALCYFEPDVFDEMLGMTATLTANKFLFMASGVPCDDLKWNFYNTPERVKRYEENQLLPDNTNDGIGRWWRKDELKQIGERRNLRVKIMDQPAELADFRINAVFRPAH